MTDHIGKQFHTGRLMYDTEGELISAHGGGMLQAGGVYYWFGETRCDFHEFPGISCYSSNDLFEWKNEGMALLPVLDDEDHDLHPSNIIERPKVIFNENTQKYVMWMHMENSTYTKAEAGVAVSDSPAGPYRFVRSLRPNGQESRDLGLFKDEDGRAYLIHSSEQNSTMHIDLLTDDYLNFEGTYSRLFVNEWREAPAVCKHDGTYFLFSSRCTCFSPNAAMYATSDDMLGEWQSHGNPCIGFGSESSFHTQVTFILPIQDKPNTFIYLSDDWRPEHISHSRYVWLPFQINGHEIRIEWMKRWDFNCQIPQEYREQPTGSPLEIRHMDHGPDRREEPDLVVKRNVSNQDLSALGWLCWRKGELVLDVMVFDETGTVLTCTPEELGDELFDLWINYYQVSVDVSGHGKRMIAEGSGWGDLGGISLTQRIESGAVESQRSDDLTSPYISLLGLKPGTLGSLFQLHVRDDLAPMRPFRETEYIALALVLNNRDRTSKGIKNRGASPSEFVWADTRTYHKAYFV